MECFTAARVIRQRILLRAGANDFYRPSLATSCRANEAPVKGSVTVPEATSKYQPGI